MEGNPVLKAQNPQPLVHLNTEPVVISNNQVRRKRSNTSLRKISQALAAQSPAEPSPIQDAVGSSQYTPTPPESVLQPEDSEADTQQQREQEEEEDRQLSLKQQKRPRPVQDLKTNDNPADDHSIQKPQKQGWWFWNSPQISSTTTTTTTTTTSVTQTTTTTTTTTIAAQPLASSLVDNQPSSRSPWGLGWFLSPSPAHVSNEKSTSNNHHRIEPVLDTPTPMSTPAPPPSATHPKRNISQTSISSEAETAMLNPSPTRRGSLSMWSNLFSSSQKDLAKLAIENTVNDDNTPPSSSPDTKTSSPARKESPLSNNGSTKSTDVNSDQQPYKPNTQSSPAKKPRKKSSIIKLRPNLVLPQFEDNFPLWSQTRRVRNTWKRLASNWWGKNNGDANLAEVWADPGKSISNHLYRTAPGIIPVRRVVVVGVHGFFPMRMLRSFIGEPTGTSLKFATEGAKAFEAYAEENGLEMIVDKIALEGEGKVFSRVENLYVRLMEYKAVIEQADCIFFAAHSQGTPVAAHLLARLVADGHVEGKRLGFIGMAGISLGPFSGMDQSLMVRAYSSIESKSMIELFQFQDQSSKHSLKYIEAIRTIVAHNAKILFIGSINDQLVPMYSSTCIHLSHPNILRAVYVDGGSDVAPEFISNLVGLSLRLKNVGCSDHGLLREISGSLAGSLTGNGHSKIYDEPEVYRLAIRHLLETTDPDPEIPVVVDREFSVPHKQAHNPFYLPWSLHGMFTEAAARTRLRPALHELVSEFRDWNPESKPLKDVKYRLSAVQAKL